MTMASLSYVVMPEVCIASMPQHLRENWLAIEFVLSACVPSSIFWTLPLSRPYGSWSRRSQIPRQRMTSASSSATASDSICAATCNGG